MFLGQATVRCDACGVRGYALVRGGADKYMRQNRVRRALRRRGWVRRKEYGQWRDLCSKCQGADNVEDN